MPSTNFDTTSGLNGGAYLRQTLTETSQNTGANQSTDSWSLILVGGTRTSFDLTNTATWASNIDGTPYSGTFSYDFRPGPGTIASCGSSSQVITHNADGTKSISVTGSIGALPSGTTGGPASVSGPFTQTPIGVAQGAIVSRLSHTLTLPREDRIVVGTEAGLLGAVAASTPEITLATLPAGLSTAPVAAGSFTNVLDALNQIIRTEQGAIFATTSGTLLAPTQVLTVRERTRPAGISYSFDAATEISEVPPFIRDITNVYSSFTANGPTGSATYTDATVTARAGSANASETVLNTAASDLLLYAQDYLIRGKNVNLRVESFVIDALTTPTDRSADLLAMVPGDRIRVTGLPAATLGFTTWDGWVLGVTETHRGGMNSQHRFEIFVQPVLPYTAVFDEAYFLADGYLTLSAALTSVATTMSVTTASSLVLLETVTFPYTLQIDLEQVTVTGCTSAAPQIATITRGVNGTTAAAHSSGANVEIAESTASLVPATTLYPATSLYPIAGLGSSYFAF